MEFFYKTALKSIKNSSELEVEETWVRIKSSASKIPFIKIRLNMVIHIKNKVGDNELVKFINWKKKKSQIIYLERWRTIVLNIFKTHRCLGRKSMLKACLPWESRAQNLAGKVERSSLLVILHEMLMYKVRMNGEAPRLFLTAPFNK